MIVECAKPSQLGLPLAPLFSRGVEIVSHIAEKFDFHNVDFIDRNSRDFGPRFVGVGVVVQKFVPQHQCNGQESEFAASFTADRRIKSLEAIDEHQGQKNDVLSHLSRADNGGDPFSKSCRRNCIRE